MLNNITVCLNNIKSEKNAEEQQQEQDSKDVEARAAIARA